MESQDRAPNNAVKERVFDFRSDDLPHSGVSEEFTIDEYLEEQEPEVRAAVDAQGEWVADTLYKDQKNLATLRLRAGMSQKTLAAKCGWEQPHISRYESGATVPSIFAAKKIAEALGVSLDELAAVMEEKKSKAAA